MAETLLSQLKSFTVVVADTGDFQSIEKFKPRDATTNPSLILSAAKMPEYASVVDGAIQAAKKEVGGSDEKRLLDRSLDRLAVAFGLKILGIVPGRVSTEVDARLSYDTAASIKKAHEIIALYEAAGIGKERVLIKLASTWEGIRAAEVLEKEGVHCNLTLLFGFHQAVACAEANVRLISPFVGRILDWYLKTTGRSSYAAIEDPGVVSVTTIYDYYKRHGHQTEVMGASFRNIGEITELAGCDLLTIAPKLLAELEAQTGVLPRKLDPAVSKDRGRDRIEMNEAIFRKMHEEDTMAKDKLAEGIEGFSKAIVELEGMVQKKLAALLRSSPRTKPRSLVPQPAVRPVEPPPSRYLFPDPRRGTGPSGVVCTGGDFAPGTLLAAYRRGIFPWPVGEDFVPWCSPDPRAILSLDERPRWSQSVRRALKKPFSVTIDRAFSQVMDACGQRDEGTWITSDLLAGYVALHELGWAHSLEVWNSHTGALAGGIYGIGIGAMFAGESMFHRETDASKVAFATIAERLFDAGYAFLDAQMMTDHLASLGCRPVPRVDFLKRLAEAVARPRAFPE